MKGAEYMFIHLLERAQAGKRTFVAFGVVALVAGALAGCGSSSSSGSSDSSGVSKSEIVVGATNALSGPGGSVCSPFTKGAAAYFDQLNDHGGVLGRTVKYTVLDDAYEASRASANMRKLLEEPVFAFVGGCGTVEANAIAPTLTAKKIPYLFPYEGLAELTTNSVTYVTLPLYEEQIKALIPYAFRQTGKGSVYTIANIWPGYESAIGNSKAAARDGGGTFVGSAATKLGTADYTPYALKIKQANPDYVVIDAGGADAAKIVNSLVEQNAMPKKAILGVSTFATGTFMETHDAKANAKILFASPIKLPAPESGKCATALKAAGIESNDPSYYFGCSQAAGFVTALKKAGKVSRSALFKTLNSMTNQELSPLLPPVTFTKENHMGVNSVFIQRFGKSGVETLETAKVGDVG